MKKTLVSALSPIFLTLLLAIAAPPTRAADPLHLIAPDAATSAKLTTDPAEGIDGKPSLKGDSRLSTSEWNEFFHSKVGLFQPNEAYKVSFDYKVLARDTTARFYSLFRKVDGDDKGAGWTEWGDGPGKTGHVEMAFVTRGFENGILIIGIQHKGALSIANIQITADPAHRPVIVTLPTLRRTWKSPGNTAYYADSVLGSDAADGRSVKHPWRSLDKFNSGEFAPGDQLFLKAGSQWVGFLAPGGSGAIGKPVSISSYGPGPLPAIDAAGKSLATVYLKNTEYWDIGKLDIANRAPAPVAHLAGVLLDGYEFGPMHGYRLHDLNIHDVNGSNVKDDGGGNGICCTSGGPSHKTRYEGLTIEECRLTRTDRNGITMGCYYSRPEWPLSTRVVIRSNILEDIGGDGIVPIGCDGCLISHNILRGGRMRATDYAAGIWPWSCDNTLVEYNEVSGMKGTKDGEGYDSDYNSRGTVFQYNFSHDNDGGFMLICSDGAQKPPSNIGNSGTVIRHNVSVNDGLHTFNINGSCSNTRISDNVFYVGKGLEVTLVSGGNWGNVWPTDTHFTNNVFYVDGKGYFNLGGMIGTTFEHNSYWGDISNRPADPKAILADPKLARPGGKAAVDYALRADSPLNSPR